MWRHRSLTNTKCLIKLVRVYRLTESALYYYSVNIVSMVIYRSVQFILNSIRIAVNEDNMLSESMQI